MNSTRARRGVGSSSFFGAKKKMSRVFVLGYGTLLIIIILLLIIRTESPFMKLSSLTIMLMLESFFAQAKVEDRFNCQTDEDCQVRWTDSVCIERNLFGSDVRQCAPHRQPIKPACRGVSFGLCPAYQSPSRGHLNLECVFQKASSLDLVVVLTSGNGNNTNVLCEPGNISSRCVLAFPLEQQNISHTIVGQFQCVDVTTCGQRSVFPDTCRESDCRDDDVGEVPCNERDTCTPSAFDEQLARHTNKQCLCQTGFSGSRCETIAGPECDVSCGEHGECVAGECVCDEKWHADVQCETCSSDAACVHGTCGEEGTCVCEEGYTEKQCDTPEHRCVDLTCGLGACQERICVCPVCRGQLCEKCKDKFCLECSKSEPLIMIQWSIVAFIMVLYYLDTLYN